MLCCSCEKISRRTVPIFQHFTGLTSINLSENPFVNGSIAQNLTGLQALRMLDLAKCETMSDENVVHLSLLTQLHYLDLGANSVSLSSLLTGRAFKNPCAPVLHSVASRPSPDSQKWARKFALSTLDKDPKSVSM